MGQGWWRGAIVCGMAVVCAGAQMGTQQQTVGGNQSVMAAMLQPTLGAPYQAEKVSRSVQKLADGTMITKESRGLIARDTEGRVREELYIVHSGSVEGKALNLTLQSASVGDPVAHTLLFWTDEKSKIAVLMQLPSLPKGAMGGVLAAPPPPPPPPGGARAVNLAAGNATAGVSKDETKTEDIGQQAIEGVLVTGKRTTTTIPAGEVGNDRPMSVVHEEWRSPELKIVVKTVDSDPRTGEQTMRLEGLTRADPDAALFQAPAGFKVQDMAEMMKGLGELGKAKTP